MDEDLPEGEPDNGDENDEQDTSSAPGVGEKKKRTRRRGVIYCRHGCGFTFVSPSVSGKPKTPADRKLRDQFDYHEQQQCPMLPRLVCPLECEYRGKVLSFAGPKALRQHFKTKAHQHAIEWNRQHAQRVDMTGLHLEAEYDPQKVHGNPRANGFRKQAARERPPMEPRSLRIRKSSRLEQWTCDVDNPMAGPSFDTTMMVASSSPSGGSFARERVLTMEEQEVLFRSSRSLEKMQRVASLATLATRQAGFHLHSKVTNVTRPALATCSSSNDLVLTANEIRFAFQRLTFA